MTMMMMRMMIPLQNFGFRVGVVFVIFVLIRPGLMQTMLHSFGVLLSAALYVPF
jgi:hypothetical protein